MSYIVKAAWNKTKWTVESGTPSHERIIAPMPEGEDVEWLQLEDIDDGFGNLVETITVDEIKKAEVLQRRLTDDLAKNEERQAKYEAKEIKKEALNLFKAKKNKSALDIIEGLEAIIDYLKDKDDF